MNFDKECFECKMAKSSKSFEILGESFDVVVKYLEGSYIEKHGQLPDWDKCHIDHYIPLSTATTEEEEVIKLNHYTNLQLLTADDNMRKGCTVDCYGR